MKLSVVLPAHNEEPNIRTMVERLLQRYDREILEVIVVDDASTDRTAAVVRRLARTHRRVRLVRRRPPSGVGRALKAGFKAVDQEANYVLMMDSDFVENIEDIQRLMDKLHEGYDGVVGSRFVSGGRLVGYPWPKLIANRVFHGLARFLLGITQRDLTNNFKLYKVEIIKSIRWRNDTFAINAETGLLPLLHSYRIAEVPVSWIQRSKSMGLSNFKIPRVGPQYLQVLAFACLFRYTDLWRGTFNPTPHPRAVKRHYEQLASRYEIRANRYCGVAYQQRAVQWLAQRRSLLEVGCGTMPLIASLPAPSRVGVDFSEAMLRGHLHETPLQRVVGNAEHLPFMARKFDGILTVNLVEHLQRPREMVRECARLLAPKGILLVITPNGDLAWALELAEFLRLKLPEGPHRFLTTSRLRALIEEVGFEITSQECFMAFPVGVRWMADLAEWWRACCCPRLGLMQCMVAMRRCDNDR